MSGFSQIEMSVGDTSHLLFKTNDVYFEMGKLMSQKEVKRAQVLDMLEEDKISQQKGWRSKNIPDCSTKKSSHVI